MSLTAEPDAADPLCLVVECSWGVIAAFFGPWRRSPQLEWEVGTVLNSSRRGRKLRAKKGELTNSAGSWLVWGELWAREPAYSLVLGSSAIHTAAVTL